MKKAIAFTLLFWVGLVWLPGCFNNCSDCPDQKTVPKYADIIGLGSFMTKQITAASEQRTVQANDKLRWQDIVYISVLYSTRTYGTRMNPGRLSWGGAAYACDCIQPGYLGSEEKLVNLTVRTVYDFDAAHPAGSVMNELTSTYGYPQNKPLNEYLSKGPVAYGQSSRIDLVIDKAPVATGLFALDVTIALDNGEVYTTRTPVIQLI